jgi:hypothetical protein
LNPYRQLDFLKKTKKNYVMKPLLTISLLFFISALLFSCAFAPVNNQYEKAGTLKKGNLELAGSFTGYTAIGGGGSFNTNNNYGFRVGYGISDKFDLKLRYERLMPGGGHNSADFLNKESSKGVNYFSLVPKITLVPEKLSLLVPLSHYSFNDEFDRDKSKAGLNSIAPQLIYTFSNAKNTADFSFGLKADCFFGYGGGGGALLGTTVGAGFSSDLSKWAIRPEIGATFIGGAAFLSYGIGMQLLIPKKKK